MQLPLAQRVLRHLHPPGIFKLYLLAQAQGEGYGPFHLKPQNYVFMSLFLFFYCRFSFLFSISEAALKYPFLQLSNARFLRTPNTITGATELEAR